MGSTNKTAHYELPQFVANDKPSWLGDVNEAMEAIDTGIYGAKSSADGAQQTANNAVAGVQSAGTRMDGIQTQLDTVATQANQTATTVTGHTSAIATNSANINTLNSRMGSTDISAIGDGTVTGAISSIAQGGGAWTLVDTLNGPASSGNNSSKVVTIPSGATEIMLLLKSSGDKVRESVIGFVTNDEISAQYARILPDRSISDYAIVSFIKNTSTLQIAWGAGTALNDLVGELYVK